MPSFEVQTEQVLANLRAALEGAGSSIAQLVQGHVNIADVEHWASFNQIHASWPGDARPARAVAPSRGRHINRRRQQSRLSVVSLHRYKHHLVIERYC